MTILWLPGYVGLFSCTVLSNAVSVATLMLLRDCPVMSGFFHAHVAKKNIPHNCRLSEVIARLCRAFFMHVPGETKYVQVPGETNDCPVMSGFFHAHLTGVSPESRTVNLTSDCPVMSGFFHAPGHSAANFKYIVSDCPVMSGFFHARWHSNRRLQFCSPWLQLIWLPGYVGLFSCTLQKVKLK